jgi:predicted Zn-dependent protease
MFSQYLLTGIMNGYGVEYEKEADYAAVTAMAKTKYNPSACVTFMERLAALERQRTNIEPGIFRTHPPSSERVEATLEHLRAAGIPYTPRAVTGGRQAVASGDKDRVTVKLGKFTLFELAGDAANAAAMERGNKAASSLTQLLRDNLQNHEVRVREDAAGPVIEARDREIVRVTAADAALAKTSPRDCADKWLANIKRVFQYESFNGPI